jgi:hypothetical protein
MQMVRAVSGVPIRLTDQRWSHIATRHPEMTGQQDRVLETVAAPDYVQTGDHCVAVYREISPADGFVVTAYFATRTAAGRKTSWKRRRSSSARIGR